MDKSGLLDGKTEIADFLGGAGDKKLKRYIAVGMPILIEDGRWLAHKDNIEEFFKHYTRKRLCPECKKIIKIPLGIQVINCPHCGFKMNNIVF